MIILDCGTRIEKILYQLVFTAFGDNIFRKGAGNRIEHRTDLFNRGDGPEGSHFRSCPFNELQVQLAATGGKIRDRYVHALRLGERKGC